LILFKTEEEKKLAKEAVSLMVERAIALDGTCTCVLLHLSAFLIALKVLESMVSELGRKTTSSRN